ncbi:MAG: hypothetical protein ACOC3G_03290 [Phycisphaeraceae bacterium]
MLKFFRKYNKQILVVGGVLLMVIFLIQPAISIFMPSGAGRVEGTIDGVDVTLGEQQQATAQMRLLGGLNPLLAQDVGDDPLRWIQLQRRANQLGLSASQQEVGSFLADLGVGTEQLAQLVLRFETTEDAVYNTVRSYLAVSKYRNLASGVVTQSVLERLGAMAQAQQAFSQAREFNQQGQAQLAVFLQQQAMQIYAAAEGHQRVSEPAVRHTVRDSSAQVSGRVVLLRASERTDQVDEPTEAELEELFEQYKGVAPGEGEPYGFGYFIPDRIRVEWLSVSRSDVADTIEIDEAEAVAYYRENEERFQPQAPPEGEEEPEPFGAFPSRAVRERVIDALREQKTTKMLGRITDAAQNLMRQPLRRLDDNEDGYKIIPDDLVLPPLAEVADQLEENYGITVDVRRETDSWVSLRNLQTLDPLANTTMAERQPAVPFSQYITSAKELDPDPRNPLVPLRLQVGVPSEAMVGFNGDNSYVFRLTDAEAGHVPESLDEVREQVATDARLLAAYNALTAESSKWLMQARSEGLDALTEEPGASLRTLPPQSRTMARNARGGGLMNNLELLGAMFELAAEIGPGTDLAELTPTEKTDAVELPTMLSLAVFELTEYQPVTRQGMAELLDEETAPMAVGLYLRGEEAEPTPLIQQLDVGTIERRNIVEDESPTGPDPGNRPGRPTGL